MRRSVTRCETWVMGSACLGSRGGDTAQENNDNALSAVDSTTHALPRHHSLTRPIYDTSGIIFISRAPLCSFSIAETPSHHYDSHGLPPHALP